MKEKSIHSSWKEKYNLNVPFVTDATSIHEGRKCEICDQWFSTQSRLIYHKSTVNEYKKSFNCDECNKNFSRRDRLNHHISSIHLFIWREERINFVINAFALHTTKGYLDYHVASVHEEKKHLSNRELCKKNTLANILLLCIRGRNHKSVRFVVISPVLYTVSQ